MTELILSWIKTTEWMDLHTKDGVNTMHHMILYGEPRSWKAKLSDYSWSCPYRNDLIKKYKCTRVHIFHYEYSSIVMITTCSKDGENVPSSIALIHFQTCNSMSVVKQLGKFELIREPILWDMFYILLI